jgi:uncharacterized protein YdeI (YjbR/CyaY-like superfamily)
MERTLTDLRKVLAANPKAKAQWEDLTPLARRDFIGWINSARQPETRKRRIASIPSRLAGGKRRPCCYALVPGNLYKALAANPGAKAAWTDLAPDERRDFVDWIDRAEDPQMRAERISKTRALLVTGKRRP